MPISSFHGLQTTLRGLLAQQRALDVTGHNVANAATAGYSRQEATMAAAGALSVPGALQTGAGAQLGSGVDVLAYRRVRDGFLDIQYRAQASRLGEQSAAAQALDRAELALAEPGENGIAAQLSRFWDAWADVANAPETLASRQALVEQASALAATFAGIDGQLALVAGQAADEYATLTAPGGDVDSAAREIAALNASISSLMSAGEVPNDLLDRRDLLVDRLAELGRVSVTALADGGIEVAFGDAAVPLVSGPAVSWPQALTAPGGRLGALRAIGDPGGTIDSYRAELNAVARTVADSVNALHGTPFFTYALGAEASSLAVAVAPAGVVASASGAPGANDVALAIGALRGGAADDAHRAFVTRVGSEVREARRGDAVARVLADAVSDRRQSVAGVSLDEEMANLVRFQRAYEASSRALSSMDEMLDVLINRTGRVGL